MPARYGEDLEAELTEAGAFVPCSHEDDIVLVLADVIGEASPGAEGAPRARRGRRARPRVGLCGGIWTAATASARTAPSRTSRGRCRSFPLDDVRAEVAAKVAAGVREIVLIAQDTGRWGTDFEEPSTLAALVGALAEEHPGTWFRVMYLQRRGLDRRVPEGRGRAPQRVRLLRHPAAARQRGVHPAMNSADSAANSRSCSHACAAASRTPRCVPQVHSGFPGETDGQFEELCAFVEDAGFDCVGVFPYSREEGTRAFDLPGQVDEDGRKADRAQRLRDVADAVCAPRVAERIGRTLDVLVEGREEDGQLFGRAMCQAPEVDGVASRTARWGGSCA